MALVAASREVHEVHNFFQHANFIINVVSVSPKRNDELLATQAEEISREIELGELDREEGNSDELSTKAGGYKMEFPLQVNSSLKKMFGASFSSTNIAHDHSVSKYSRGDAWCLRMIITFDFVFILLMMEKIMKITMCCAKLSKRSQLIF